MPSWTDTELAYLAGIIDGEGCFSISTVRKHHGARLDVVNTNARLIDWLHQRFDGTVIFRDHPGDHVWKWKPSFTWTLCGRNMMDVLTAIAPFMIIKDAQARLLLEYLETVRPVTGRINSPLSAVVIARRVALKAQLSLLNKKGIA